MSKLFKRLDQSRWYWVFIRVFNLISLTINILNGSPLWVIIFLACVVIYAWSP